MSTVTDDSEWPEIEIDSLSHDGRGVGRNSSGKVVFVDYALPGELVRYRPTRSRRKFSTGSAVDILRVAEHRVEPRCDVFGTCGGCILQHCDHLQQVKFKQDQLLENLVKIGHVTPENLLEPVTAGQWGYRRRARLGVRDVAKKGGILVGFRERNKSYVTPIEHCDVLHPAASAMLGGLQQAISDLSCRDRVPQIEVAVADNAVALVFRHLDDFTEKDRERLRRFAVDFDVQVFLQPGKLSSVHPLWPLEPDPLFYHLEESAIDLYFLPTDFVQVNGPVNERLVKRVLDVLEPNENETILDLFCGLGNFTLPLACRARHVSGAEGDRGLVERAEFNAVKNGIGNVDFLVRDLFEEELPANWADAKFDKVLIDPPRSGALNIVNNIDTLGPARLVYVSCNPATLARDAELLCGNSGYRMSHAGVIDMFPHTAHVESMAVFERA